jgi:hypothetical protein
MGEIAVAQLQTRKTKASASSFLNGIEDDQKRKDSKAVAAIMQKATGAKPAMWGPAIIGFGSSTYVYPDGREMDWMLVAFSPRKQNLTLYLGGGFPEYDSLLKKLGTHSCSKACLYIKRLSDVHVPTLTKLVQASVKHARKKRKPA